MAVSAFPAVVDALVAAVTAERPDVLVLDGEGSTDDPGDFLMVGSNNATGDGTVTSGALRQSWANANATARDEEGEVSCFALSWNGDGDPKTARDRAFSICESVASLCRDTPDLGVPQLLWTSFGATSNVSQIQTEDGALCTVEFQIFYRARI